MKDTIIGPIVTLFGYLMNEIFLFLDKFGIANIGLSIILFTFLVNICLIPLNYKQQKFAILNAKLAPEFKKIQAKYKGKDKLDLNISLAMQTEIKQLYAKYGISNTGGFIQTFIQLPIIWALYRVIYNIPKYVLSINSIYSNLISNFTDVDKAINTFKKFESFESFKYIFESEDFINKTPIVQETFIDMLNKASVSDWNILSSSYGELSNEIINAKNSLTTYNTFLGLNIFNSPLEVIKNSFSSGDYKFVIIAILFPVISFVLSLLSTIINKKMNKNTEIYNTKGINTTTLLMMIMSLWFCFQFPIGIGIYWIAGSLIGIITQILINLYVNNLNFEKIFTKNLSKYNEERNQIYAYISEQNARKNLIKKANLVKDLGYVVDTDVDK